MAGTPWKGGRRVRAEPVCPRHEIREASWKAYIYIFLSGETQTLQLDAVRLISYLGKTAGRRQSRLSLCDRQHKHSHRLVTDF